MNTRQLNNIGLRRVTEYAVNVLTLTTPSILKMCSLSDLYELVYVLGIGEQYEYVVSDSLLSNTDICSEDIPYARVYSDINKQLSVNDTYLSNEFLSKLYEKNLVLCVASHTIHTVIQNSINTNLVTFCVSCKRNHPRSIKWFSSDVVENNKHYGSCNASEGVVIVDVLSNTIH